MCDVRLIVMWSIINPPFAINLHIQTRTLLYSYEYMGISYLFVFVALFVFNLTKSILFYLILLLEEKGGGAVTVTLPDVHHGERWFVGPT